LKTIYLIGIKIKIKIKIEIEISKISKNLIQFNSIEKEIGTDDILVIAGDTFFYNDFYLSNFLATRERGGNHF